MTGDEALSKPSHESPAIRVVMMPRDTNPQGTIFGGVILSLIDQAAFVEALRQSAHHRLVTVAMDKIEFKAPVRVGDVVSVFASTVRRGRTSLTVHVDVMASRPGAGESRVTSAVVVLVAVDDAGRPIPIDTPTPHPPAAPDSSPTNPA